MVCDICSAPGQATFVSSDQMRKAVSEGFNPYKLNYLSDISAEQANSLGIDIEDMFTNWKNGIVLPDTAGWNICDKCIVHVNKYL